MLSASHKIVGEKVVGRGSSSVRGRPLSLSIAEIQIIRYKRLILGESLARIHSEYPRVTEATLSRICNFLTARDV